MTVAVGNCARLVSCFMLFREGPGQPAAVWDGGFTYCLSPGFGPIISLGFSLRCVRLSQSQSFLYFSLIN